MQTFLPYENFTESAKCLDYRRLGKQRVEAKQLLTIILGETDKKGWANHPARLMWEKNPRALALYGYIMCKEWKSRGYKDNLEEYFKQRIGRGRMSYPKWLGNEDFHSSHRSNLLRKDKKFYSKFKWTEKSNLDYIWPK